MHIPALANYSNHPGTNSDQGTQIIVVLRPNPRTTGAAKRDQSSLGKFEPTGSVEELYILRICPRPPPLYEMDAEPIELGCNFELILHREGNPLPLCPVTKCSIIKLDVCHGIKYITICS
jgi:hypothetical protein